MHQRTTSRGFTLLELILTVGLIALLAALVIVSLGPVRRLSNRTDSSNALRQMALGYRSYATDSGGQLMPGYVNADLLARLQLKPKLESGTPLIAEPVPTDPNDASGYVWRLAPYLDHAWDTMFVDYRNTELLERLQTQFDRKQYGPGTNPEGINDVSVALVPSFGLNSIFVGGDNVHGGGDVTVRNPWTPVDPGQVLAATRLSEVRNPSRLIVFAPVAYWSELDPAGAGSWVPNATITDIEFGYPQLQPPMLPALDAPDVLETYWQFVEGDGGGLDVLDFPGDFSAGGGIPFARWGRDKLPVAHLDGSVTTENLRRVAEDMSLWSPFASTTFQFQDDD
jgi:prepilin-type N-terminal cleavage/methylation domain-containing protein